MTLDEIRKKINTIDFEILKLLNSRMEFALRTKKFKMGVADPRRENEVIEYIQRHSQGLIEPDFCKKLFVEIIGESKRLQQEDVALLGFQGEHGSYSEVAARRFNPNLVGISCGRFDEIFEGVESGLLHYGVVPVESTLGGTVTDVNECLARTSLQIIGEIKLPIRYCLLTLPDTDPNELRVVYSHRQALSQCQDYLQRNRLEGRPYHDVAAAAKMLVQQRPEASGAIAGSYCAEYYHLRVVAEGIEDHPGNITRFLILSRDGADVPGNKCSIIFVAEHKAGALFKILKEFADIGINLTRIESMPNRLDPGNYVFFLDFFGSDQDPRVTGVLDRVREKSLLYRFQGCYSSADEEGSGEAD
jgi:prephenate dehydratase/chorismate mutase